MTNTQFEADQGRRAELRQATEKVLAYLAEEIGPHRPLPRGDFNQEAKDDQTLARCLLGILLRKAIDHNPEGATYLLVGDAVKQVEVTPEALLTTLEALKNIFDAVPSLQQTSIEQWRFRELVEGTIRHLNKEEITALPEEVEKAFADYSNEALATCLISSMLGVIKEDREKLATAGETMELADNTLKLMLEAAQVKDAWIRKKGLAYPDRELKKAA